MLRIAPPPALRAGAMLLATALVAAAASWPSHQVAAAADGLPYDLRVGSFNVRSVTKDYLQQGEPWRVRRPAVVRDILGERVDVLGLQELSQNPSYRSQMEDGPNQMEDLVAGLNQGGAHYALTNNTIANCVRAWTNASCVYQDRGASRETRIIYNQDTLDMLDQGAYEYAAQTGVPNQSRYLVYATFQVRATGQQFFFATTHLATKSIALQSAQTAELIDKVGEMHGDLPVIITGDFQRSKWSAPIDWTLKAMKQAGYGDVLDQKYGTSYLTRPRAQRRINGWFNSKNNFDRDVTGYAYEENHDKVGNNIDWIWATNALPVKEWKVVVHYLPTTMRLTGVIPSDHMMVRATISLI